MVNREHNETRKVACNDSELNVWLAIDVQKGTNLAVLIL